MQSGVMSKRLIGAFAAIVMAVGLQVPGLAFAEGGASAQPAGDTGGAALTLQAVSAQSAGDVSLMGWDGTTATAWTSGSGTQEDPYLIESAANLAYLRDQVDNGKAVNSTNLGQYSGVYFKQTADIDLGNMAWDPIGCYSSTATARAFSGHYDGGGHTVSGLNIDMAATSGTTGTGVGLFGYVKGNSSARASIANMVVEGSVKQTSTGSVYTAALSGYSEYTDFTNCGNDATVSSTGNYVAGITGTGNYCTIEGCYNHASITSTSTAASAYIAGISATAPSSSSFTVSVTNCYNTGAINGGAYAGGIAGQMYGGLASAAHTFQNCYNAGTVTATTGAGGIIAYMSGGSATAAAGQKVDNCHVLAGSATKTYLGYGSEGYLTIVNSSSMSADNMQAAAFATTLGDKFIKGATYPVLYWEAPAGIPVIDSQNLDDAAYVKDASDVATLSISASGDSAQGDLVYRWYKASKADLSDATAISGVTTNSYTPPVDSIDDAYYYCTVNNNVQALDGSGPYLVQSGVAHIQVWSGAQAVAPTITTQPTSIDEVGQTSQVGNDLSVVAAFAGNDENDTNAALSYQWQISDSESGTFTDVEGATTATWGAPTDKVGTKYYRCVVTTTREEQSKASTTSDVASVTVVGLTISNQGELKAFAQSVDEGADFKDCTVTLANDIEVTGSWNPIGAGDTNRLNWKAFCGEFDGAGHTITFKVNNDANGYYALFGNTGTGASIHDLVVAGTMKSSGTTVAGVVAQVTGNTVIERVGNEAAVSSGETTAAASTAGIVGMVSNGTLTVSACYNKGVISASGARNGGIVGQCAAGSGMSASVKVLSSYNTGSVTTLLSGSTYTAGIVGFASSHTISNTYSIGTVTTPNSTSTASGAIFGGSSFTNPTGNNVSYWLDSSCVRAWGSTNERAGLISKTAAEFADETSDAGALKLLSVGDYAEKWAAGSTLAAGSQASPALSWEKQQATKHEVTFVDENGTTVLKEATKYDEGTKADDVQKPADPTKTVDPDDGYTYTFDAWVNAETQAKGIAGVTANATYKATYTKTAKSYTITYNLDDGTEADPANPTTYTVETEDFTLAAPSKTGHSFAGWTGTDLEEATTDVTVAKGSLGNRAYTATWNKASYDVTFDSDGGSAVDKQTVEYGSTATKPANPTKDGFDFVEWQKDGAAFDFATEITGATQLKASWKEQQKGSSSGSDDTSNTSQGQSSGTTTKPADQGKQSTSGTAGSSDAKSSGAAAATTPQKAAQAAAQATPAKVSTTAPTLKAAKTSNNSMKLAWGKVAGAKKYVLYGNKCNPKNKLKKIATVKGTSYKVVKAAGKKLKKGTYYKFQVYAYDAKGKVIAKTLLTHVATTGGKYCNVKKVTTKAKGNKVSLKAGKTFKLGAKQVKESKKLKYAQHVGIRYATSNKTIATVSKAGTITAKKKGTCYVYATAQNGVFAKVKVTVK